jgi:hypothetical protein
VTNVQLYLAIGVPVLVNAAMFGLLVMYLNARLDATDRRFESINHRFDSINHRFDSINHRFDSIDQRFDDMRNLWLAELHRVEEVLDARLKHLEER